MQNLSSTVTHWCSSLVNSINDTEMLLEIKRLNCDYEHQGYIFFGVMLTVINFGSRKILFIALTNMSFTFIILNSKKLVRFVNSQVITQNIKRIILRFIKLGLLPRASRV